MLNRTYRVNPHIDFDRACLTGLLTNQHQVSSESHRIAASRHAILARSAAPAEVWDYWVYKMRLPVFIASVYISSAMRTAISILVPDLGTHWMLLGRLNRIHFWQCLDERIRRYCVR